MSEQKPSIGRIVHYLRPVSLGHVQRESPVPAVITKTETDDATCHLYIMSDLFGCYFELSVPYAESPTPGHWSWPPRV
jgi:hypothetical protein